MYATRHSNPAAPAGLFHGLSEAQRQSLLGIGKRYLVPKAGFIFHAGAPCDYVYMIVSGRAKIYEMSPQGKEVIMWFCFAGELFGLTDVWAGGGRRVYARACCEVDLLRVERASFLRYLTAHPELSLQVIEILSQRMRLLGDMLLNLTTTDAPSRLAKLLSRLFQVYGQSRAGAVYIDMPLTHQEMADMIGCCRQTVTTTLGNLKRGCGLQSQHKILSLAAESAEQAAQILALEVRGGHPKTAIKCRANDIK